MCKHNTRGSGDCMTCIEIRMSRRVPRLGQSSYGQGSRSGNYGSSAYGFQTATFDGLPALKRSRDGVIEFFYQEGEVDMDDPMHGHAIIKNGKLIYKSPPGQILPTIDRR